MLLARAWELSLDSQHLHKRPGVATQLQSQPTKAEAGDSMELTEEPCLEDIWRALEEAT